MATIVNDRDVLLQAAGTRVLAVTLPSNITVPNTQVSGLGALATLNTVGTPQFTTGITPVEILGTLPVTGNFNGRMVFLTADQQLYRYSTTLGSFTLAVPAVNITGTIGTTQIGANAVTTPKLAANSVTTAVLAAGAVTATELAANAVIAGKISAGAVSASNISVTNLSSIHTDLGTVTAGNITGTANLTVAGKAQFTGNFSGASGFNTANEVNYGGAASFGVMGFSGAAGIGGGVGVYGQVTIGAPSSSAGVQGTSSGTAGIGVQGIADSTGVGVHAIGDGAAGTGIGLKIVGKLQWGLSGNLGSFLTWPKPANTGAKVLCDDGTWINLASALVYVSSGGAPATSVIGSIVVDTLSPIGQIRLAYYAP